jgi:hypothetical protein
MVLWTTSRCGGCCAAVDPHEVDDGVAAIDRTTIPNFDPVRDHVAIAAVELLLYSHDDVVDDRHDGDDAGTATAAGSGAAAATEGRT